MAHTKGQKLSGRQGVNVPGKRRGIKVFGGENVVSGNILVRQVGNKYHPGDNVEQGRDFTLFATADGVVKYRNMTGYKRGKKIVDVVKSETK
jgi:large subunit ribosomal protein L27